MSHWIIRYNAVFFYFLQLPSTTWCGPISDYVFIIIEVFHFMRLFYVPFLTNTLLVNSFSNHISLARVQISPESPMEDQGGRYDPNLPSLQQYTAIHSIIQASQMYWNWRRPLLNSFMSLDPVLLVPGLGGLIIFFSISYIFIFTFIREHSRRLR